MSKKLIYLLSFILVFGLISNASAGLPAGWQSQDINTSGGSADESGGTWTVIGDGGDIWGSSDAFHFAYVPLSGDGMIIARVVDNGTGSNTWAKGGVMIRETLDAGSKHAMMIITDSAGSGRGFQFRPVTDQRSMSAHGGDQISPPMWVKLTREGNTFTGYLSEDGVDWVQQPEATLDPGSPDASNPATIEMATDVYIGLCVTSHASGELRTYIFDNVSTELPTAAMGPNPKDGSYHPDTWANVTWNPGAFAVSHDVYFGDNFDDVDAGAESTFLGNQTDTFFVVGFPGFPFPEGLMPGSTYYWRIDEVNEANPDSPWRGNVWSFTVPPKTAYLPDPADGAEAAGVNDQLSWTPGFGAKLHTVYFGETFDEVDAAAGGSPQGTMSYAPGTLKMAKTYYWRVDEFDIVETHKGDVWSFTTEGAVSALDPANGAVDVTQTPVLTWAPGLGATYDIYFGADPGALEKKASGNLGQESYEPGQLEWNATYFWRVDEANSANADSPWTGPLWSFTTANFLIIDDMEAYNDLPPDDPESNRIFNAWLDGFGDLTNGSLVGYDNAPFAEQSIVHSGNQSMPMSYDNSAADKSEATLTLTANRDWTVKDVDTLTIWYRGDSGNAAEQMYVTLNGTAKVDNDDPEAATVLGWIVWNISLQAFADQGVNLTNVNSITIGLSSVTGGIGTIYVDDIRLYPPVQ
jgi:hypothetical protein